MPFQMVNADRRLVPRHRERIGDARANQKRAREPRPLRERDCVDAFALDARLGHHLFEERQRAAGVHAETVDDVPNERIAWRSLPGADVTNAGRVVFQPAPGGRGTEVRVELEYDPPFGKLGSKVAMFWREEPGQQVYDDLRHFKQVMELGEIVLSDATKQRGPHPAQPDDRPVEL